MKCPRCQQENPPQAKFCLECAAPLALRCANCGTQLPAGAKFCFECATPVYAPDSAPRFAAPETYTPKHLAERILTSKAALEGERKQVTVLFADLKGSMELLADRDPEEARKILDPVLEHMMEAVHRYEGTVNQVMGDGIMALFGAPLAHEDHAVRACYAALRMQNSVRRYAEGMRRQEGISLRIRVGLNSGEVVVRAIRGDLHMDYTAVGQTTHLAARMEQLADPGAVLLAPATLGLAEDFVQVRSLGPTPVKGMNAPIEVYELTGATAVRSRFQAHAARGLTKFVGRTNEIAQLNDSLGLARNGRGQIVAVVGEPGVGKSRLFWEFVHSHRTDGCLAIESASVSYGKATSYLPVIELLRGFFQIEPRDDTRKIREKVTGKLISLDRALEPALPALLALLDLLVEDEQWTHLDPLQRRQRTLDAVKRLLLRESQVQPLVVVFEDLHWIDGETQAVIDSLVEGLPTARLLLLVNYRPEYHHGWGSKTYYRQHRIDSLPAASAEELLDELLGTDVSLRPLTRLLVARTEGNPFFLEESVRALVEAGTLVGKRGVYRLIRPVQALQLPATAQTILAARIDRLDPEEKRLLQAAAVIGKDVPFALLHAVAEEPEDRLLRAVARLQAAEFLYEARLFPDLEYTFKHALTHEVAYGAILHERRQGLHARVVEALERLYSERPGEQVERLAYHAVRGELWQKAVENLQVAGDRAWARSAPRQAAGFYEQALLALGHLPRNDHLTGTAIELHIQLRGCLFSFGELHRLPEIVNRATELALAIGDRARLSRLMAAEAHNWWIVGRADQAVSSAERALDMAEEVGDHLAVLGAGFTLGQALHLYGNYHRCVETLRLNAERAKSEFDLPRRDLARFWAIASLVWLSWALAELGDFPGAVAVGQDAVTLSERHETTYGLFHAYMGLGSALLAKGDSAHALEILLRGQAAAEAADLPLMANAVQTFAGYAYLQVGRLDEACVTLERSEDYSKAIHFGAFHPFSLTHLSEAYLQRGFVDRAASLADNGAQLTREYHQWGYHAWAVRQQGEIASHPERRDGAIAASRYRESLTMATELGMHPLIAHCHAGLGKLYWRTGEREEAQEHLTTATTMYREMGMTYWLEQVEAEIKDAAR